MFVVLLRNELIYFNMKKILKKLQFRNEKHRKNILLMPFNIKENQVTKDEPKRKNQKRNLVAIFE